MKQAPKVQPKKAVKRGGRIPPTYHKAGMWRCPRCANTIEVFVKMTFPPACSNHKGQGSTIMEIVKKEKTK